MADAPPDLVDALLRLGLARPNERVAMRALEGGVSSDIWRADLASGPVCIKRALPKLKVDADWCVPVERGAYEVAWIETAAAIEPDAVPRLLAHDAADGLFVMAYLDPSQYRGWKASLMAGQADPAAAQSVGRRLAAIHAATAGDATIAARFDSDAIFHAIRLEPYLLATARRHPDRAAALESLVSETAETRLALVHGDVSPKNILIGPHGPVFLDAECAWYGDPAFDLAFCLNHLLLKCVARPGSASRFLACFDALAAAYLPGVAWEAAAALEARAARLLPGLLLARVDGKSPVEYVVSDAQRDLIRRVARASLAEPAERFVVVRDRWTAGLAAATDEKA